MLYRKPYQIKDVILSKQHLQQLSLIIFEEFQRVKKLKHTAYFNFSAQCEDDFGYESNDLMIFKDGREIDTKKTKLLKIRFSDHKIDNVIVLNLTHGGNSYSNNYLEVQGSSEEWVNNFYNRLSEHIQSIPPQGNWFTRHRTFFLLLIAFGLVGALLTGSRVFFYFNYPEVLVEASSKVLVSPLFEIIVRWSVGLFLTIGPAFLIREGMLSLWPTIEFDFGPEHLKKEKNKRHFFYAIIVMLIIPLFVNLIYDGIGAVSDYRQ